MITTPRFSFVTFTESIDECCCEVPLPVRQNSDVRFYIIATGPFAIGICDLSGGVVWLESEDLTQGWHIMPAIDDKIACGECFRMVIDDTDGRYYSNSFIHDRESETLLFEYIDKNDSYFDFGADGSCRIRLPAEVTEMNPETEKEEYTDANGVINFPFKTRRQKAVLLFDYMPFDLHEKIQMMLMHLFTIDGAGWCEKNDYEIDYDNIDDSEGYNLFKAKTEIMAQEVVSIRNC